MSAKVVITQEQSCNTNAIYKQCMHTFKNLFVLTFCDVFSSGILVREALQLQIALVLQAHLILLSWKNLLVPINCKLHFISCDCLYKYHLTLFSLFFKDYLGTH